MRVEASSMLMISSATRRRMSSRSARAISRRWSWPPLSWCGYLSRTSPGFEADGLERRRRASPATPRRSTPREVRAAEHREDAVGLEDRVVRAERVLEDALHVARSSPSARLPSSVEMSAPSNVIVPAGDRARRRRIILPIVDLPLPLSPISETTSPGCDLEGDVADGLRARRRRRRRCGTSWSTPSRLSIRPPPSSRRRSGRARSRRTAAPPRTSRTRAGSGP